MPFQVSPSELEGVLLRHLGIVDAGVFGLPDPQFGELPTALVVRSPDSAVTEREIQQYIKGCPLWFIVMQMAYIADIRGVIYRHASIMWCRPIQMSVV